MGEQVLAYNETTGTNGNYTVQAVLINNDPAEVFLTIDGEKIETTPEHPWYTEDKGWVNAGDLRIGEHIRKAEGESGEVQSLEFVRKPKVMYNLTVEQAHTFFVGQQQWLVHNASQCNRPGGYRTFDIDPYENLSEGSNRALGHANSRVDNQVQAHHPIQDQWSRVNVSGYNTNQAPAILLPSSSGMAHARISATQRIERNQRVAQGLAPWTSTTIRQEFDFGYRTLINSGLNEQIDIV